MYMYIYIHKYIYIYIYMYIHGGLREEGGGLVRDQVHHAHHCVGGIGGLSRIVY